MSGLRFVVLLLVFLAVVLLAGAAMTSGGALTRSRREPPALDQDAPTPPEDLADDSTPSRSDDL